MDTLTLLLVVATAVTTVAGFKETYQQPLLKRKFQLLTSTQPGTMQTLALFLLLFVTRYAASI